MRPTKTLAILLFSLLSRAALAQDEPAANSLTPHLDTLWLVLYILGGLLFALVVWELLDKPRAVTMDAGLAAPKELDNDYIDPTKMKFAEPAKAAAPPSFSPPPMPEPPARQVTPSAERMPAPPPAAPSGGEDDNPFRKLSKLGGEDDSPLATPRPPVPRSEPAAVPVTPAASAPSMDSGSSSGGWADLLQRVRAGEPSSEDSGKLTARSVSPPSTEDEAPSSSAAWESLLKKSVNDLGATPDVTTVSGEVTPRGAIKLGLGGGGDEEKSPVDPLRMALDNPSTDPEENLPDFVKKATRTIALDLKKGGEQTPPPPMPKTEG